MKCWPKVSRWNTTTVFENNSKKSCLKHFEHFKEKTSKVEKISFLFYCFVHFFLSKPCLFSKVIKDATQAYVLRCLCSYSPRAFWKGKKRLKKLLHFRNREEYLLLDLQHAFKAAFWEEKILYYYRLLVSYFSLFGFLRCPSPRLAYPPYTM